jgi:predicted nucleic acid-binding Zn finger protein
MPRYRPPERPKPGECDALAEAVHERMLRACEVATDYEFEDCGSGTWFVSVPGEDDRSYVVQLGKEECSCPDFTMNPDIPICKHLWGLRVKLGMEEGKVRALQLPANRRPMDYASWFVPVVDPDQDDPYRD